MIVTADMQQILLIWAGVVFASVLRAFTGFGFALAVVPVLAVFLAPAEVVVLAASLALVLGFIQGRAGLLPLVPGVLCGEELEGGVLLHAVDGREPMRVVLVVGQVD